MNDDIRHSTSDMEREHQNCRECGERNARETLLLLKKQALHTMWLLVGRPRDLSSAKIAELAEQSSGFVLSQKRWHDFLDPVVRKVAINFEEYLEGRPVKHRLEEGELDP